MAQFRVNSKWILLGVILLFEGVIFLAIHNNSKQTHKTPVGTKLIPAEAETGNAKSQAKERPDVLDLDLQKIDEKTR